VAAPAQNVEDWITQLRSGVKLCVFVNALKPGIVKRISNSEKPFPQRAHGLSVCFPQLLHQVHVVQRVVAMRLQSVVAGWPDPD
jgi:hypothetical protein